MVRKMKKGELVETAAFYKFYQGKWIGPWIYKNRGTGRVLNYLLDHQGEKVSLEEISRQSNWKNPKIRMREFIPIVNNWSRYQIESVQEEDKLYYRLTEATNKR